MKRPILLALRLLSKLPQSSSYKVHRKQLSKFVSLLSPEKRLEYINARKRILQDREAWELSNKSLLISLGFTESEARSLCGRRLTSLGMRRIIESRIRLSDTGSISITNHASVNGHITFTDWDILKEVERRVIANSKTLASKKVRQYLQQNPALTKELSSRLV